MADKKVANGVVALSSAAVLAVYGAGYARTRAAADRFAQQATERHPRVPGTATEREAMALGVADAPAAVPDTPASESPRDASALSADTAAPESRRPSAPGEESTPAPAKETKRPQADVTATKSSPPTADAVIDEAQAQTATPEPATIAAAAESNAPTVPPPPPAPVTPVEPAKVGYKDGTYYGWGSCRHGDIQAAVVIESGRITAARVERCLTRYACNWVDPIPPRILLKQGTTYDYVSGATESSDAFQDAVAEALSQAK